MTHCKIIAMLSEIVLSQEYLVLWQNPFSVYCDNINEIMDKYANFNLCKHRIVNTWNISINEMDKSKFNVLKEMIDIRDGRSMCENLTREEVLFIIDDICLF